MKLKEKDIQELLRQLIDAGPLWYRGKMPEEGLATIIVERWADALQDSVSDDATTVKACPWRKAMQFPPPKDYYERVIHDMTIEEKRKAVLRTGAVIWEDFGPCLKAGCELWDDVVLCCGLKFRKEVVRY